MPPIRTVIDSDVLRYAFQGFEGEENLKALEVLDDQNREFVAVDFVSLELIPKPTFNRREDEVQLYQSFFSLAPVRAEVSSSTTSLAMRLAATHDINPMDALIVSSAIISNADEFITFEKPTKPMFRVKEIKVTSLRTNSC